MKQEDFEQAVKVNNKALISKYLYLVWSLTDNDYFFRHHLETKNSELKKIAGSKESNRYLRLSLKSFIDKNPIKIRINNLGEISKVGE
jgi:CRISPR-associated endonuclease Csn1